ncbi:M48 family metallopeptidase [Noviherbaspirillum galbum]|uniref:M48 family metalloprotease n=1 Tax=Noviherbaspirillum galbum TaxID=2709383 RepID=A0A6B3SMB8_9BURK|nr:M48 family metallopeptidase [Noviherbaspirillum galbum]NEX61990.1 M48 family metalloprotease [Noviherbaspirillum galbum]
MPDQRTAAARVPAQRWGRLTLALTLLLGACATETPTQQSAPQANQPGTPAPAPAATPAVAPPPSAEETLLRSIAAQQDRLYRVSAPLIVNNADLCRSHARNLLGLTAKNRYSFSTDMAEAARRALGLGEQLQVTGVLPGGGAARSGIRPGDILVAVDDKPFPAGENAERQAGMLLSPMITGKSSLKMTISRNGANLPVTVPPTYGCAYGIELGNSDNVTAYSDGHRVLITRGMLNTLSSDDELAYVMAKEMAHNSLAHANRLKINATAGGLIDKLVRLRPDPAATSGLAGLRPMPQELDAMADKLSLYLLARAGYNVDRVIPFWERMASQYPATNQTAYTALHPATEYRLAAMKKALADIKTKMAARKPLMP